MRRRKLFMLAAGVSAAAVAVARHRPPYAGVGLAGWVFMCLILLCGCNRGQTGSQATGGDIITASQGSAAIAGGGLATFMGNVSGDAGVGPAVPYLYVFILTSDGSTANHISGGSGIPNPWTMSETFEYSAVNPGAPRRFVTGFDGRRRIVTLGGREFSLGGGDFFVVRLDANWNASVEQVHRELADVSLSDAVKQQLRPRIILHASPIPLK